MNRRQQTVAVLLGDRAASPACGDGAAYAPANIALVKYWGKRDVELNLPVTSSLSVSMGPLGTHTTVRPSAKDGCRLQGEEVAPEHPFALRLSRFLDLFRTPQVAGFQVDTRNTVPTAAGVASSASGFAALVRALDGLFHWNLPARSLSMLARLGSGSACRSIFDGFVEWQAGQADDGLDSWAVPLPGRWPGLRIGLVVVSSAPKPVGSREAMEHTVRSSPLYAAWPATVARDLAELHAALAARDLEHLGRTAEGNALAMHATMLAARPSVCYWRAETLDALDRVRRLRAAGVPVWCTLDAGPNLKLMYEAPASPAVHAAFAQVREVAPFAPEGSAA